MTLCIPNRELLGYEAEVLTVAWNYQ